MTAAQTTQTVSMSRSWRPGAAALAITDVALRLLGREYGTMRWILERTPPRLAASLSGGRALRTARAAARRVPAYRDYLRLHGIDPAGINSTVELPETDKASYIDR